MNNKELIEKLLKVSEKINAESRRGNANYITLPYGYVEKRAQEKGVSFDEMYKIIVEELQPIDKIEERDKKINEILKK